MDMYTAFRQTVARTPEQIALLGDDGEAVSYSTLDDRATALAAALDEQVGHGRVATLLEIGQPAVEVLVASVLRGAAHVPLNTREAAGHNAYVLEHADADALVFDDGNVEGARELLPEVDLAFHVGSAPVDAAADTPVLDYADATAGAGDFAGPHGREFGVFFTSGSTGHPKGIVVDNEQMWYAGTQAVMEMGLRPGDVALLVTPLFHLVTPHSWVLPQLLIGGTLAPVTFPAGFDPGRVLDAIEEWEATALLNVPAQLERLTETQAADPRDLSSLRLIRTGGAPLDPDLVERIREHLTPNLHSVYGLTESVSNLTHAFPEAQREHVGTVGRASFNWELRVVEPTDVGDEPDPAAEVGPGGTGEILARGPLMTEGYIDNPDAEEDLFVDVPGDENGRDAEGRWIRTRDVATVDEEGYLYIVDRVDNMIVSGGENIYPREVERVLERHPGVDGVGVIGAPHPRWGTAVVAVVVGDATATELDEYCRDHDGFADFKRPRAYRFADELPRSPIGKLRRGVIQEQFGHPVEETG